MHHGSEDSGEALTPLQWLPLNETPLSATSLGMCFYALYRVFIGGPIYIAPHQVPLQKYI